MGQAKKKKLLITRRMFISNFLFVALYLYFGPGLAEMLDWDKFRAFCRQLERDLRPCRKLDVVSFNEVLKKLYPQGMSEMLYERSPFPVPKDEFFG